MVTPEDARKLELAKNNGRISLALRNPLDRSTTDESMPATGDLLDPRIRGVRGTMPNIRDDRVWQQIVGGAEQPAAKLKPKIEEKKEPPKPKLVVDVYRGDKHVQEIFQ
jgi:hypothetical protein